MPQLVDISQSPPYVLVSAHHCAPGMGSEHAVGWNIVSRLARWRPVLLITQDNEFRPDIERSVATLRAEGCSIEAHFVLHGSRADGRRNELRVGYYLTYVAYQWRVYQLARQLMQTHRIVAVHHLTIVGFREPGFLWKLGLPFVWGPVGGLVYTPRALYPQFTAKVQVFVALRSIMTALQFALSPRVRSAYRATQRPGGAFIAATPDIGSRFERRFGGRWTWTPETGAQLAEIPASPRPAPTAGQPLRLLWLGGLIDRKPMGLLLEAMAALPDHQRRIELTVVGDGESRQRYEARARELGVRASFKGWMSHADAQRCYATADVFVLLSAMDLTTNVVFESLSQGLPVMCLDHHGYSYIVDDTCGFKIPVRSAQQIREDITRLLASLSSDRARLAPMRDAAVARARQFTWDANTARINALLPKGTTMDSR